MPLTIDIREFADRMGEALERAANGEDVILADGDVPKVRLVPCAARKPRTMGLNPGAMIMAPNFNDPLPDEFWLGES